MIIFILLISRHGKTRLNKFYIPFNQKERHVIQREVLLPSLTPGLLNDHREVLAPYALPRMEGLQDRFQEVSPSSL